MFPLMSWSQDRRSEGVRFCFCSHRCRLRITGQRECVFVCVSIDAMVSESQVRGSAFLFVFPLMPWSRDHRSEGLHFCLCFY